MVCLLYSTDKRSKKLIKLWELVLRLREWFLQELLQKLHLPELQLKLCLPELQQKLSLPELLQGPLQVLDKQELFL
jgi:hypothetical protein